MKKKLIIAGAVVFIAGAAIAKELPINPISPGVRDKLKESIELVSNVEEAMAPEIVDLQKTYKSYEGCKDNPMDKGCVEIKSQLGKEFKRILKSLEKEIPEVKSSVISTAKDLGVSIKGKTNRKDIKQLYQIISQKREIPVARGPLSKKLSDLLTVVGGKSNVSILELSLSTQADLISAVEILEYLEVEISRLVTLVDMGLDIPIFSEEMAAVMNGVSELFGFNLEFESAVDVPETGGVIAKDDWLN